ncbi:MAG: NAD(P)H-dependent oxidoreductase [Christensenellaceae bacterium]
MDSTLFIDACVREKQSRTLRLCAHYLARFDRVDVLHLSTLNLQPLNTETLKQREGGENQELAKQFLQAESIVIGAPYWDLSFPAILKIYLEQIMIKDITFSYGDRGDVIGHCKAKELVYITTSGGPIVPEFGYGYIKALANILGIQKTTFRYAEWLDVVGADVEKILRETMDNA